VASGTRPFGAADVPVHVTWLSTRWIHVLEGTHPSPLRAISSPQDAYAILSEWLESSDRETFAILMLDNRHVVPVPASAISRCDYEYGLEQKHELTGDYGDCREKRGEERRE